MKKVLIIDDSPDILEAISMILTAEGYASATISKGVEAYAKAKSFKPDLIILDILLSGNDGRIICKKLKKDKATKHIPIILISAHPTAKSSLMDCLADGFVPKPFSIEELMKPIKGLIGGPL